MPSKSENVPEELVKSLAAVQAVAGLTKYSTEQAEMLSAAARLLSTDDAYSVNTGRAGAGPRFRCGNGACFQIVDNLGRHLVSDPNDLESACGALDAANGILRVLETRLSLNLEPVDIVGDIDVQNFVWLALSDGMITVILAIPNGYANAHLWSEQAALIVPSVADTPCLLRLQCVAAHLKMTEIRDLAGADMLLLTHRLPMHIGAGPASFEGIFDAGSGLFTASADTAILERSSQMNDDDGADDAAQFHIPVSIRLPDQMVSMEILAALKPGANLNIGPLLQGLPVDLMIAGNKLASGEIVQIGDNFAVLIAERGPLSSRDQATEDGSEMVEE